MERICMKTARQKGFSLIEVLVSILVLALGVIGVAGMQLSALRTSQQSTFQTVAVQLASEMADRMRANNNKMKLADEQNPFLSVDFKPADAEPDPPAKLCHTAQCNDAELADFDIYDWEKRLKAALPGARARICRDSAPWDAVARALTWTCDSPSGNNASLIIKLGWLGKGTNPDGSRIDDAGKPFPPSVAIVVQPYIK
jgi:type IV pilus assembly protein PilV